MLHFFVLLNQVNEWCQDLLTNFFGALLGFGTALFIYYLQNKKDRLKEKIEKDELQKKEAAIVLNEHIRRLDYFNHLLNQIVSDFSADIDSVNKYITAQGENFYRLETLKHIHSNNFERIKSVDAQGIFESYYLAFETQENTWIDDYTKLNKRLDFLEGVTQELQRINFSNLDTCYKMQLKLKDEILDLGTSLNKWCVHFRKEFGDTRHVNPIYKMLDYYLIIYADMPNDQGFKVYQDTLVRPLLLDINKSYVLESFGQEILQKCQRINIGISDLKYELQHIINEFKKYIELGNESLEKVKHEAARISKHLKLVKDQE